MKSCFFTFFLLQICSTSGKSPVFLWSNDRSTEFPQVIAGHHVLQKEFASKYLAKVSDNVVVFAKDELSVTDILLHGGVYGSNANHKQLKMAMIEFPSMYLPSVENPVDNLLELSGKIDSFNLVSLHPQDIETSLPKVNLKQKSIIVIDLSTVKNDETKSDAIIGQIISYLRDKCKFTAFLTGRQAETFRFKVSEKHEPTRHLMEAQNLNNSIISNGSFIMSFDKLKIGEENFTINDISIVENGCNVTDSPPSLTNCSVTLLIPSRNLGDIYLSFQFLTSGVKNPGYWYVRDTLLTYNGTTVKTNTGFIDPTPLGFSYSCSRPRSLAKAVKKTEQHNGPTLSFTRLQIQVFHGNDTNNHQFGQYNDCVGFFSIAIWMFLICAAVLLSVLAFGIIMLLGINTMDRYDDPKGKTISVPLTD